MLAMALGFISAQRRTDGTHAGVGTGLHLGPTPKAFANPSPGLERQRQPWD